MIKNLNIIRTTYGIDYLFKYLLKNIKICDANFLHLIIKNNKLFYYNTLLRKKHTKENFINYIKTCENNKFVIYLTGFTKEGGHANLLLFNNLTKEVNRYEPHGNTGMFFSKIEYLIKDFIESIGYKYIGLNKNLCRLGLQHLEEICMDNYKQYENFGGFCASFSWIFMKKYLTSNKTLKELEMEMERQVNNKDCSIIKEIIKLNKAVIKDYLYTKYT